MQAATDDRLVGRLLEGRYRLRTQVARGGMSTVYGAIDERLDREVAVKIMSPALSADPAFADRFSQEARVAARLSHPNAVSVYDQGVDGTDVFLVMELVRGRRTLRDLIRQYGALTPALAVSIMQPVLAALAAAHRAGLVHRDVKPENILLSDDGAVKVADFGLARAVESELSNTRTGLMMGTVAYCPPEQLSRGAADARSDVYSAGVLLFELLTGSVPYTGDTPMAVAYQHVNSDVPPPSSRVAGIAWQLDDVVRRATSRDAVGRQLDAGAFLAELHDVRVDLGLPVVGIPPRRSAPPPTQAPRVGRSGTQGATRPVGPTTDQTQRLPRQGGQARQSGQGGQATNEQSRADRNPVQHTLIAPAAPAPGPSGPSAQPRPAARVPSAEPVARRKKRRRPRTALVVTIIVLLLGAGAVLTGWWFAAGRYDRVPNVNGEQQQIAVTQLQAHGFKVNQPSQQSWSETVTAGSVISTSPGQSSRVLHGRAVDVVVSRGKERFAIPAVANSTPAVARQAMPSALTVLTTNVSSDSVPAGMVIGTTPAAGQLAKRGDAVTIQVSNGPPVLAVPDVSGFNQAAAQAAITKAGFTPAFTQAFSDTVDSGVVISQLPLPKASAVKFSTVNVVISKGPQTVVIPEIPLGSPADEAQARLKSLGLDASVKKRHKSLLDFSPYANQVVAVDPPAGSTVNVGSKVEITAE